MSGAGKSTISRLLLEAVPDSLLVAEDQTILLPESRTVFPFARAAAERSEPSGNDVVWQAFGSAAPRRLHAAPRFAQAQVPLVAARVFFIGTRTAPDPLAEGTPQSSVTWWSAELEGEMHAAGLPLDHAEPSASAWLLHWKRPLVEHERQREFDLLSRGESLLLKAAGAHTGAHRIERPPAPILESIPASAGLLEFAAHLRPPIPPPEGTTGGRILMRLARAFSDAQFHRLEPGGTPAKTVDAMKAAVGC